MEAKRVTLFAGHYGSGKTNIAVNFSLWLARQGKRTAIGDLDIVNPYYRAKDSQRELEAAGVRVIASAYANSNVDVPALPQEMYALTENLDTYAVLDIGGDDRGALALGRYTRYLKTLNYRYIFLLSHNRRCKCTTNFSLCPLKIRKKKYTRQHHTPSHQDPKIF